MLLYTLDDFELFKDKSLNNVLPNETRCMIDHLSGLVGSPEYIKTPQFKNKTMGARQKKKRGDINDDDWDAFRSFKVTELGKSDKSNMNFDNLRRSLNMITPKTYNNQLQVIKNNIIEFNEGKLYDEVFSFSEKIFAIISSNFLYSEIFAKLFKDLTSEFEIYKHILKSNLINLDNLLSNIEFINPDNDYAKFCEINKNNEIRRANCLFYINLMKIGLINSNQIYEIISNLLDRFEEAILEPDQSNQNDELSEIIFIMITNAYSSFNHGDSNIIVNMVKHIGNLNINKFPSLSNKAIFKFMDILDKIN